jgi:hypothetical protein
MKISPLFRRIGASFEPTANITRSPSRVHRSSVRSDDDEGGGAVDEKVEVEAEDDADDDDEQGDNEPLASPRDSSFPLAGF